MRRAVTGLLLLLGACSDAPPDYAPLERMPTAEDMAQAETCEVYACPAQAICNSSTGLTNSAAISDIQCRAQADGVSAGCTFRYRTDGKTMAGSGVFALRRDQGRWCGGGAYVDAARGPARLPDLNASAVGP